MLACCSYTFGVFCAVLVLVNYLYVCFFFPCVVAVRDRYFLKERCCFCCLRPCTRTAKAKVCVDVWCVAQGVQCSCSAW